MYLVLNFNILFLIINVHIHGKRNTSNSYLLIYTSFIKEIKKKKYIF